MPNPTPSPHLSTYLNDHLAGSVSALELLAHLESTYPNSDTARLAAELRAEILADRKVLEDLMARAGIPQSTPRKVSAWLAEKLAQLKLRLDDRSLGDLHLLEAADALSLGIEGKRLLWLALATASTQSPTLRGPDYDDLIHRAEHQRHRLESLRLNSATSALTTPHS